MSMTREQIELLVRSVINEYQTQTGNDSTEQMYSEASGVIAYKLPQMSLTTNDRFETGNPDHDVKVRDVYSLEQSKNLGCGLMEMNKTTFDWTLNYDEIDYVIEGELAINIDGKTVSAKAGEIIFIPAGSTIQFSVKDYAKFMYVTYPANWEQQ